MPNDPNRIKGKGARIIFAALLAAFRRLLSEGSIAMQGDERDALNAHLDTAQAVLDSDGDGVSDDLDPAPHDATVRTAAEAARAYVERVLPGLVAERVALVFADQLGTPVPQGAGQGGPPAGFANETLPPVNNATVDESASAANAPKDADHGASV